MLGVPLIMLYKFTLLSSGALLARLQRDAKALKTLRTMVSEAHSSTFMPIPGSEKVNDGFKAATNALVFDVLMAKLRDNFCGGCSTSDLNLSHLFENTMI